MNPTSVRPFCFNVVGHLSDNLGLGVAARAVANLIERRGLPLALLNLPSGGNRTAKDAEHADFAARSVGGVADLPYGIDLYVVGVDQLHRLQEAHPDRHRRDDVVTAALCFWELPTLPPRWLPRLQKLDVVVAASDFIRYAFQFSLSGPSTIAALLPVALPAEVVADRARFAIGDDTVAFVTSFEPYSDIERKNIDGVIEAFRRGSRNHPNALLIVKVNNAIDADGKEHAIVSALHTRCADDPRIRIVTTPMRHAEVLSLYASADVFLSLHRAEGLGLGMAEAMTLGKPVVATDWSGNLTFMTHGSGCLVRTRLVDVRGATHIYSSAHIEDGTSWAEPDLDHAAEWIARLIDRPELRARIGTAARERMAQYNTQANQGAFLDELKALWLERTELGMHARRSADDTTGRKSAARASRLERIQELERELDWIRSRPAYRAAAFVKSLLRARGVAKEPLR